MTLPPRWRRSLQIAVAVLLMVLLWAGLDGAAALGMLRTADPGWLVAALLALTAQTLLSAWRWRLTAQALGLPIAPGRAVREYYIAQIVNQSLPGGVMGDVGRAVRSRAQAGLRVAGQAVVIERVAGQLAMIAMMLAGALAVTLAPGGIALPVPLLGVLMVAVAAIALLALWPGRAATRLRGLRAAFRRALLAPQVRNRQIALSLCTASLNVASFAFCARATGTDLGLAAALALVPLILSAMALPLSVAGWGLREGAAAVLFPLAGASATAGLAASVAFGLMFLLASLPGLALILTMRARKPRPAG